MLLRCTEMLWNAREVYFITSGEVPSCTKTFPRGSAIFSWNVNLCWSGFEEMAHCAGQMCILKYVFMEWHTNYCAGRIFSSWNGKPLCWSGSLIATTWNFLKYTSNILDKIRRICQLQQWNGTLCWSSCGIARRIATAEQSLLPDSTWPSLSSRPTVHHNAIYCAVQFFSGMKTR